MKKLLSMAVALVASASMFAQAEVGSLTFIPKVGVNVSTLTKSEDSRMLIGLAAGVEANYQVMSDLGVSAGLIYSMQGAKQKDFPTTHMDYINVPILANYYPVNNLAVKIGIQPAIRVSASNDAVENVGDKLETFDFSIPVGVAYEFKDFVVDARYNIGITRALKEPLNFGSQNSVFQLSLGYKIPYQK